jgi:hypothetical protein
MIRLLLGLATAVALTGTLSAGELDKEFSAKAGKTAPVAAVAKSTNLVSTASELDAETPTQAGHGGGHGGGGHGGGFHGGGFHGGSFHGGSFHGGHGWGGYGYRGYGWGGYGYRGYGWGGYGIGIGLGYGGYGYGGYYGYPSYAYASYPTYYGGGCGCY